MPSYVALFIALGIGLILLAAATWLDVRTERRLDRELLAPPQRGLDSIDELDVDYVTQAQIDAASSPASTQTARRRGTTRLEVGHSRAEFATDGDLAVYFDPHILVVADPVTSIRELMTPLHQFRPLIVIAPSFHDDVLTTLVANRKQLRMPVVAVETDQTAREQLTDLSGASALTSLDLRAGYVPAAAVGRLEVWESSTSYTTVSAST